MSRPTQAVVLAGGRGERLRPLTDAVPKAMLPFYGRPFLEYLVELFRGWGLERILLLVGYLPNAIRDHFGEGSRWGVEITHSVTAPEALTLTRLRHAEAALDDRFVLAYCDNYVPLPFERACSEFAASGAAVQLTAYANGDHLTRDNLRIGEGGWVERYDRTRISSGLRGVDIGFALVDLAAIAPLPDTDSLFEEAIYPRLVDERLLRAFVTEHRYYSIGSLERLPRMARFLAREPTVILDRDGVLNEKPPRAQYVRSWDEFCWRDGALDALRLLHDAGVRTLLATNQAGVARGALSEHELDDLHEQMGAEVAAAGGRIERVYSCLHGWDDGCACRKPQPGMLIQAQRDFDLDLSRTPVVGDDERDAAAAAAAGCPFLRVGGGVQLLDLVRQLVGSERLVT